MAGHKEKRFPDEAIPMLDRDRDFPTRPPWLDRKTPPFRGQRPLGLGRLPSSISKSSWAFSRS